MRERDRDAAAGTRSAGGCRGPPGPACAAGRAANAAITTSNAPCQRRVPVAISPASARSRSSCSAGAGAGEGRGEIGAPGAHRAQHVVRRLTGRRNHGDVSRTPGVTLCPLRNSRAVMTRRPSGWTCRRSSSTSVTGRNRQRVSAGLDDSAGFGRVGFAGPARPASAGPGVSVATAQCGESDTERRRSSSRPAARAGGRGRGCECGRPAATSRSGSRSSGSSARTSPASRPAAFPRRLTARQPLDDRQQQATRRSPTDRARLPRSSRPGRSGVDRVASIGPASSSFTTRMIVMPVTAFAGDHRAVHRRRAAVFRQQRSVDVDHAEPGDLRAARPAGSARTPRPRRGRASARRSSRETLRRRASWAEAPERRRGPPAPWWASRRPAGPGLSADRAATRPPRPSPTATRGGRASVGTANSGVPKYTIRSGGGVTIGPCVSACGFSARSGLS